MFCGMVAELGALYLPFAAEVLQGALPARGYTAHVLGYTVHALLEALSQVRHFTAPAATTRMHAHKHARTHRRSAHVLMHARAQAIVHMRPLTPGCPTQAFLFCGQKVRSNPQTLSCCYHTAAHQSRFISGLAGCACRVGTMK